MCVCVNTDKTFGWRPAVFVGCCYGVTAYAGDGVSTMAMLAFQFWMSAVALTRELLEPFFTRLPDYRKHPAILRKVHSPVLAPLSSRFSWADLLRSMDCRRASRDTTA